MRSRTPARTSAQCRPSTVMFSPADPGVTGCPSARSASITSALQMLSACQGRPWWKRVFWRSPITPRKPISTDGRGCFGTPPSETCRCRTVPATVAGSCPASRSALLASCKPDMTASSSRSTLSGSRRPACSAVAACSPSGMRSSPSGARSGAGPNADRECRHQRSTPPARSPWRRDPRSVDPRGRRDSRTSSARRWERTDVALRCTCADSDRRLRTPGGCRARTPPRSGRSTRRRRRCARGRPTPRPSSPCGPPRPPPRPTKRGSGASADRS